MAKTVKVLHADPIYVSTEMYGQFLKLCSYYKGNQLPPRKSDALHQAKFSHLVPLMVEWLSEASLSDYARLFFHGMKPEGMRPKDADTVKAAVKVIS